MLSYNSYFVEKKFGVRFFYANQKIYLEIAIERINF